MWFKKKRIYMDFAAATPVLPEVRRVMEEYESENFYNPRAIYTEGVKVRNDLDKYRTEIARTFGATSEGVIFTSGGTEANNLAILGACEAWLTLGVSQAHIIISNREHSSVGSVAEKAGEVSIWQEGVPLEIKPNTVVVSINLADSQDGTVQDVSSVGRLIREYRKKNNSIYPLLHTDASTALNFLDISLEKLHADLITINAAKIYGPKGVGALIVRRGVKLAPTWRSHEGTEAMPLIVGLAKAVEIRGRDREDEQARLELMRENFLKILKSSLPQVEINEPREHLPNIVSASVPGLLPELVALALDREGIMVSVGSACSLDGSIEEEKAVRFSFGRSTKMSDVELAAKTFCKVVQNLLKYQNPSVE